MPSVEIDDTVGEVLRFSNTMPWKDINQPGMATIPALRGFLIDPNIYLDISFFVERIDSNGETYEIRDSDKVCLANYPINTLFRSKDIEIRGVQVMPASTVTGYTEFIRVMQDFDEDGRKSALSRCLWQQDVAGGHNSFDEANNEPYKIRHEAIIKRRSVDLYGPLLMDPLRVPQYYPDDCEIRMVFHRQNPVFALNGEPLKPGESYQIVITRANLCFNRLRMRQGQDVYRIAGPMLRYPYTSLESRFFIIPGKTSALSQDILSGPLPNRIFFIFLDQDAFMGKLDKNPFEFLHCYIQSVYLRKNQNISLPADPFTTKLLVEYTYEEVDEAEEKKEEEKKTTPGEQRANRMRRHIPSYLLDDYEYQPPVQRRKRDAPATTTAALTTTTITTTTTSTATSTTATTSGSRPKLKKVPVYKLTDLSRLYVESTKVLNQFGSESSTNFGISYNDFTNGYFMVPFDLRTDRQPRPDKAVLQPNGTLRLEVKFHPEATFTDTIVLLCLFEYQRVLNIPPADKGDVFVE